MNRAEFLRTASPHIIADVTMYATENGGRAGPAYPGWGCPCMVSRDEPLTGWDAWPLLFDDAIAPGDRRRLGFYFLSGKEAARIIQDAGFFYLWEGKFVGEAVVVTDAKAMDILLPHETELLGQWIESEGKVQADAVCKRIYALTNGILVTVQDNPKSAGWTRLFQDPADGRYWERTYPQSGLHGGGPPMLRWITEEEVRNEYSLLR